MKKIAQIPRLLALLLTVTVTLWVALPVPAAHADAASDAAALRAALDLAAAGDWPAATAAAKGTGSRAAADVIEWQRLRAAQGLLGEYEAFLARRADWPGLPLLKEKGEVAVARSDDPARVIAYFGAGKPRTGQGAVALVKALAALGRQDDAGAEALRAWTEVKFTVQDEAALLALHGPALGVAHEARLDRILWNGARTGEGERMLARVGPGWQALARARMALRADAADAPAMVDKVPQALAQDAGLAYERFLYRMRHDRYGDATTLILDRSGSAASLGDPLAWAEKRAALARALLRADQPHDAYAVAAGHQLRDGPDYADLEFVAGFAALRKLDDPDRALIHFARLKAAVATPISLARAWYWEARAHEAKGASEAATAAYRAAARHQTAYYGLLAAEKLGLKLDESLLSGARPSDASRAAFATSSVLEAALGLAAAGERTLSKRFFLHLAEAQDETGLEQLADLALQIKEPHIAVLIAKAAAERGLILPRAYFPVPDFVPDGLAVSRALALAITRRESEFDPKALSPAGASGLMQLMPGTAELVAKGLGLPYDQAALTSDPAYNVTLGAAYLREMADEFGPAIALIAAGYNAGPRRPRDWIAAHGDPRRAEVDVVDWVETIPFTETRTYVMRVAEGVVIYRAKLKGVAGPVRITAELTGR